MKLESVVPDKGKKMLEKEEKTKHEKKTTVEEALRILEEHSRKVKKTREVLHSGCKSRIYDLFIKAYTKTIGVFAVLLTRGR